MKEVIALIVFVSIVIFTIYLLTTGKIDWKLTTVLLAFSVIAGFAISNYDAIDQIKGLGIVIKKARADVALARDSAITEIEAEVVRQKEEISLLVTTANETRRAIESQRQEVERLALDTADAEQRVLLLAEASEELALLLTRITWFTQATKSEFGTSRATTARDLIFADLDTLLAGIIPDETERTAWIKELQDSIPQRNQ